MKTITLIPIAMVTLTSDDIYTPSRIIQSRTITNDEFMRQYANSSLQLLVSFSADGKSNPQSITAYSPGLDCWFIVGDEQ